MFKTIILAIVLLSSATLNASEWLCRYVSDEDKQTHYQIVTADHLTDAVTAFHATHTQDILLEIELYAR
jgi:hypothetical protein